MGVPRTPCQWAALALALVLTAGADVQAAQDLCLGECTGTDSERKCVFKFSMDIFAGETGYYRVDGCEGTMPTLGMMENTLYTFEQHDKTNWFHPLGFAYGPDGVYKQNDELEKGVVPPGGSDCDALTPCQYPQYQLNGENIASNFSDPEDFGLDEYEGVWFSGGRDDWIDAGLFSVNVNITDPATKELFYFCHIHDNMSGRIKVLDSAGNPKSAEDITPLNYTYHTISEFDAECGTHDVEQYQNGNGCPDMTFLCSSGTDRFSKCMVALDCAMHVEMRTNLNDPTVTFIHQMIAHHRNAVNMAKVLLKANPPSLKCGTNYDGRRLDEDSFCHDEPLDGGTPLVTMLWDIINGQNAQITLMRSWLRDNKQKATDNCEHESDNTVLIAVLVGVAVLLLIVIATVLLIKRQKSKQSKKNTVEATKSGSSPVIA